MTMSDAVQSSAVFFAILKPLSRGRFKAAGRLS
jgi:hypothetical protein